MQQKTDKDSDMESDGESDGSLSKRDRNDSEDETAQTNIHNNKLSCWDVYDNNDKKDVAKNKNRNQNKTKKERKNDKFLQSRLSQTTQSSTKKRLYADQVYR